MAQLTDPFIGANWGWDEGENGWGVGLNETLIQYSFLHNRRIDGIVGSLPGSPTNGQAYFLTSDNRVYFRAVDSWYSSNVPRGMDFILKSTEERYVFNGTSLVIQPNVSAADDVEYDNSVSGLVAENVQSAIDEIADELEDKVDNVPGKQLSTEDYTTEEKDKLATIEDGATANSSDSFLLDRANHDGTQAQSTVTDLVTDLAAKQSIANLVQNLSSPSTSTYLSTQGLAEAFSDIIAGESYQGEWNASTNTPTLTSGVGTEGFYYQVSVAGTTSLDGISSWALGDEVFFNGSVWLKRANYQSVTSVNGQTGPVVLTASDVGAVSSVSMTVPTGLEVSGSPITSTGTFTVTLQAGYSIPNATSQNNWNTAFNERNRWDGGATGLVAATGRTSLGLGTAATSNVTTSGTDVTVGSVLTVGYQGLGGGAIASSDWAAIPVTRFSQSSTNGPGVIAGQNVWGVTIMDPLGVSGTSFAGRGDRFFAQGKVSSTLSPWREIWTDANLTKISSATDTTTGRVTLVGYAGWGTLRGAGVTVAAPDLNAWTMSGTFYVTSATNQPPSVSSNGYFTHENANNTGYFRQTYTVYNSTSVAKYERIFIAGTPTAWQRDWNTGNTSDNVQTMLSAANNAAIRSAIELTKVTSVNDTTAGSVVTTSWMGLGASAVGIGDMTIAEVNVSRFFRIQTGATGGSGANGGVIALPYAATPQTTYLQATIDGRVFVGFKNGATATPTWTEQYGKSNTSANVQTMLSSADNADIRSNISAAKKTVVVTVSTSTHNVDTANESAYHRFTFSGSKSVTVRPNSTHVLATDGAWVFRNSNSGNLTIVAGSGVTINPPYGGTLVLEPNMVVTLQKVGTNEYDLIGQTVSA